MTDVRPADYVTRRVYTEKESKGERIRARARSLCCALHSGPCPCPGESVWRFGRFGNLTRSSTSQQAVPVQYCAVTRPRACTHTQHTRTHFILSLFCAGARAPAHFGFARERKSPRVTRVSLGPACFILLRLSIVHGGNRFYPYRSTTLL